MYPLRRKNSCNANTMSYISEQSCVLLDALSASHLLIVCFYTRQDWSMEIYIKILPLTLGEHFNMKQLAFLAHIGDARNQQAYPS